LDVSGFNAILTLINDSLYSWYILYIYSHEENVM
jgi:hypothetical protein